jgi:predicted metalloprotease with PDZ domain
LRDLFQWMDQRYAKLHRSYPDSAGVEEAAELVTGQRFQDFFADYVAGVKEFPYDDFFRFVGLQVVAGHTQVTNPGFTTTANFNGQPEVVQVEPNGEAQRLGMAAGDRVTALNGSPADAYLDEELSRLQPGTTVRLQLQSRGKKREVELRLGSREQQKYDLQDLATVTSEQRAHRTAWIHGDDEAGSGH